MATIGSTYGYKAADVPTEPTPSEVGWTREAEEAAQRTVGLHSSGGLGMQASGSDVLGEALLGASLQELKLTHQHMACSQAAEFKLAAAIATNSTLVRLGLEVRATNARHPDLNPNPNPSPKPKPKRKSKPKP